MSNQGLRKNGLTKKLTSYWHLKENWARANTKGVYCLSESVVIVEPQHKPNLKLSSASMNHTMTSSLLVLHCFIVERKQNVLEQFFIEELEKGERETK